MWKILAGVCLAVMVLLAPLAFRQAGGVLGVEVFASFCVLGATVMVWEFAKQSFY